MTDKLVLGQQTDGTPLSFPMEAFREKHFSIQGATGQMKSMFLISLLLQFFAMGSPIVFLDLGGDAVSYWLLSDACAKCGKQLRLFSLNPQHHSYYFDPLLTGAAFSDLIVAVNAIASGLSLWYGESYGRSYWGRLNLWEISQAFQRLSEKSVHSPTSDDLICEMLAVATLRRRPSDISEAALAAEQLSQLKHFGRAPDPDRQLNLAEVIDEGDVAYFWLPAALYGGSARSIATLASWCLMVEMANREERGLAATPVHVAKEEFAQIASGRSALESELVLSRKWGLQIWHVYQSAEQLATADGDLNPILRDNTQRFLFTVASEREQRELMACSRDEIKTSSGKSFQHLRATTQIREFIAPVLERNSILEVSGKKKQLFAVLNLGDQHRDPIPFEMIPPTKSIAEHAALKQRPMPRTPQVSASHPHSDEGPTAPQPPLRLQAKLAALYQSKLVALGRMP